MNEEDIKTIQNMIRFGGSFVRALGEAAMKADSQNLDKIKEAFHDVWERYRLWHSTETKR